MRSRHRSYGNNVWAPNYLFTHKKYTETYNFDPFLKIAAKAMPIFKAELDIPDNLILLVKPVRGNYAGMYYEDEVQAVADPRRNLFAFLSTIAHELVHAEQYHQGRLTDSYHAGTGWLRSWDGELVKNKGSTVLSYLAQPWEVEARDRQDILAIIVCEELGINVGQ